MKTKHIAQLYNEYAIPVYNRLGIAAVRGSGSWLWDAEGNKYLDLFPGWGVGTMGHCHPHVVKKVREQVNKLIHVPNTFYNEPHAVLSRELVKKAFPGKIFVSNSGAESVEAAIKLARKYGHPDRWEIITCEKSFHGRTMGALAATGQVKYHKGFEPMLAGFRHVPFNRIEAVQRAIRPETVAVMIELIQGEGGVHIASHEYVRRLRRLCDERKLLLIFDEVTTGVGRTGTMFCFEQYGVTPDILLLAKGMAGGLPLGVMIAGTQISDIWEKATHATTFGGNPLVAAAGVAALEAIKNERLLDNVRRQGEYLLKKLKLLQKNYPMIQEVRGRGLMIGIELDRPGLPVVQAALRRKLLINCTQERILRLYPAFTIKRTEVDHGLKLLEEAFAEVRGAS